MEESIIKDKHPSICYNCSNSRKPWSENLQTKGYVGCTIRVMDKPNNDFVEITDGKEVAEGWVDLRSKPFSKGSGATTNFQLLTLEIKKCNMYDPQ